MAACSPVPPSACFPAFLRHPAPRRQIPLSRAGGRGAREPGAGLGGRPPPPARGACPPPRHASPGSLQRCARSPPARAYVSRESDPVPGAARPRGCRAARKLPICNQTRLSYWACSVLPASKTWRSLECLDFDLSSSHRQQQWEDFSRRFYLSG